MSEQRDWLDGPKLVAWLEDRYLLTDPRGQLGKEGSDRISKWKAGRAASVYTADRILLDLGVCLGELPDSLYRGNPREGTANERIDAETRRRIVALAHEGKNFSQIGKAVGCDSKTAARYVRKAVAA
ncbi:MAG TPA: hypothetical protein VEW07_10995 [Solirubrobacterales bacterium]|nr:hypothetical protein [Solirubrobacterales bacterium]